MVSGTVNICNIEQITFAIHVVTVLQGGTGSKGGWTPGSTVGDGVESGKTQLNPLKTTVTGITLASAHEKEHIARLNS